MVGGGFGDGGEESALLGVTRRAALPQKQGSFVVDGDGSVGGVSAPCSRKAAPEELRPRALPLDPAAPLNHLSNEAPAMVAELRIPGQQRVKSLPPAHTTLGVR